MYLKRLELCGFKSFGDKTRLDFGPGITSIIGPNGCGKSNIADAIRWCLGEQSSRSLRSHQMMDVLFSGSQSRQATGMAEVSMTFDNSQNILSIDYSEVTITRRLFRSGESEYYINKVQCRLKDVKDLFLDTGIGAEGYSIMEQGKVEFILTSRPEERRELFEEAAGVSKYKARREETLRKLEKVEIDMNRVNDMLSLLKEQISSLDAAARKARQYQKHQEDLKRLETASLIQQIARAEQETERIRKEMAPVQRDFEKVNTSSDRIEADIALIRLTHTEKDERYIKLQNELSHIKSEVNLADERIRMASQRETELTERGEALKSEIETDSKKIEELTGSSAHIEELCGQLSEQVVKLEQDYKQKEQALNGLRGRISDFSKEENGIKGRLFNLAAEKTGMHNEHNRLISLQTRHQEKILSLQKELTRFEEQLAPLTEIIKSKKAELSGLEARGSEIAAKLGEATSNISTDESFWHGLETEQNKFREKMISLESKIQTLREWEEKDPQRASIRAVLTLGISGLRGPVSSLIRIVPGAEEIAANSLGDKLNYLVCDSVTAAQSAIRHLEENNLGRCTFIVADRVPDAFHNSPIAQPPAGRALISLVQFDPADERVMKFICGETLIDGSTIYGSAIIQGGGQITIDKPMLFENQIGRLNFEIEACVSELSKTNDEVVRLRGGIEALNAEKKAFESEFQKIEVTVGLLKKDLDTQKGNAQYIEKGIALNRDDINSLGREDKKTAEEMRAALELISSLDGEEQGLKKRQQSLENDTTRLREEEGTLNQVYTDSRIAWATQEKELQAQQRERQNLLDLTQSLKQAIEQSSREIEAIGAKIEGQKGVKETESRKLKESYAQQGVKEKEVTVIAGERQSLLNNIEQKNTVLHELRASLEALKQKIHNLQLDEHSFELQKQNTEQRLKNDFLVSYEESKQEYLQVQVQEEEVQRLKRRIESMGSVNLAAPEEYANIEERYNFLLNQQQDLIKAKEDLHRVINKINQNTLENFNITFTKVRENFQNIYRQLFEGGEADLVLTDAGNMLETGIDIVAQPPGKKLQNIALLSGGEKALTAIALLFSFYMVRPSPFCILDEVDAPLDEANIGRFTGMVKSFAFQSQFLIVTHNKRTMETADVLYGVTMEELGVSKIISVRLNREELAASA
jgi:chromosome segregation protein